MRHGLITTWVYAVLSLAVLGLGLLGGGSGTVVAAVLVAGASVVTLARRTFMQWALLLAYGFAFTTTWNAVQLGPIRPADVCLLFGFGACVAGSIGVRGNWPTLPPWLLQLAAAIIVVATLAAVLPYAPDYLRHRPFLDSNAIPSAPTTTNWISAAKWLVAVLLVPPFLSFVVRYRREALARLATWYAAGAAVSGAIAFTDRYSLTAVSFRLGTAVYGTRQPGLTLHPNHLAATCILAAPIACWRVVTGSLKQRILGAACLLGAFLGVFESGSRGGALVFAACVGMAALMLRSFRRRTLLLAAALPAVVLVTLLLNPALVTIIGKTTRLTGDTGTEGSDLARNRLASQAIDDLHHSPIYGIGLQVSVSAHDIYLQLVASGGILLFTSFVVMILFSVRRAAIFARVDQLGVALGVSIIGWALLGVHENFLTDRYLYVPIGLVVAAGQVRSRLPAATRPGDDDSTSLELLDAHVPVELSAERSTPPALAAATHERV